MKNEKKQTGRVNHFMVLAGGYLVYLAYSMFRDAIKGETSMPLLGIAAGAIFAAVGAWLLYREWKAYQYGKAHIDDPESWGEDSEEFEDPFSESLQEPDSELDQGDESEDDK